MKGNDICKTLVESVKNIHMKQKTIGVEFAQRQEGPKANHSYTNSQSKNAFDELRRKPQTKMPLISLEIVQNIGIDYCVAMVKLTRSMMRA